MIELTKFTKHGGPLTKRISVSPDGTLIKDGSACLMAHGTADRVRVVGVHALGALIEQLTPSQAIALGALHPDLPDKVEVVTKKALLNGVARPDVITRTGTNLDYRGAAVALLDYDTKGMPTGVAAELKRLGGFWPALLKVLPVLGGVARVTRRSTSSGLSRSDTGEVLPGSDGVHVYVEVNDGADGERFLRALHHRCWLAGLGWMVVSSSGALLERSIVDRMVGGPERLVFEGGPVLEPPLVQDTESRRPIAVDGAVLDTAVMATLNEVISKEIAARPASRDIDDAATRVRKLPVPNTHVFSASEANVEPEESTKTSATARAMGTLQNERDGSCRDDRAAHRFLQSGQGDRRNPLSASRNTIRAALPAAR
jgi:hypothetical protein